MITISLIDFVLTGNFGGISLGMTKREIIDYLGVPDETTDFGGGTSGLFYNGFEFFYWTDNETLFGIQNDNLDALLTNNPIYRLNKRIIIDTSFFLFGGALTYEHLTRHLRKENIEFDTVNKGEYDEVRFFSGVIFDFEHEEVTQNKSDRGNLKLNGIRLQQID